MQTVEQIKDDELLRLRKELREAAEEIHLLRAAVVRFGDRARMATVEPSALQQAIDRAFETRSR